MRRIGTSLAAMIVVPALSACGGPAHSEVTRGYPVPGPSPAPSGPGDATAPSGTPVHRTARPVGGPGTSARTTVLSWWAPAQRATWHIQYTGDVDLTHRVDIYDLDGDDTTRSQIDALNARGVRTVCYISAGSWENYRTDRASFPSVVIGSRMDGWPDEKWLDIRRVDVLLPIMTRRMQVCKAKGFDAVDADNVMGYQEKTGFPLTASHQLTYNRALARAAHRLGLGFGLKNDPDQVAALNSVVDFAVNEECVAYKECDKYAPMLAAGKAVLHVEYAGPLGHVCASRPAAFSTVVKDVELGPGSQACR